MVQSWVAASSAAWGWQSYKSGAAIHKSMLTGIRLISTMPGIGGRGKPAIPLGGQARRFTSNGCPPSLFVKGRTEKNCPRDG